MAKLVGAYETIDHREVNGWTVTLFHNLSHNGTQPHGSFSATVREGVSEDVLSFYGETREAVEREVLHIVGVSPLNAAALVEENAAGLRGQRAHGFEVPRVKTAMTQRQAEADSDGGLASAALGGGDVE